MNPTAAYSEYLENHILRKISIGKSGADVYELDGNRIAKHVLRSQLKDDSLWEAYRKEALFYSEYSGSEHSFLPKVYVNICNADEILIVMKKYHSPEQYEVDEVMLGKIMDVLAKIHTMAVPGFLRTLPSKPTFFEPATLAECVVGWQSVLAEHGEAFEQDSLQIISEQINPLNELFYDSEAKLTHGDFHCDNVLLDAENKVIICDWQSCSVGNVSGDISFFLSRLSAGGYRFDTGKVMEMYCRSAEKLGISTEPQKIEIQIRLANLNTSFRFWHMYLHGCSVESVKDIYVKMVEDAKILINNMNGRKGNAK